MNLILLLQDKIREMKLERLSTRIEVANQYLEAPCHNPIRYAETIIDLRKYRDKFKRLSGREYGTENQTKNENASEREYSTGRLIWKGR